MFQCTFELNGEPLSTFKIGPREFAAFSGMEPHINRRPASCMANVGPIPPGEYYIFDRRSGGVIGRLLDSFGRHEGWFALHAIDGRIDDETWCNEVKRGAFRLHPKGMGISKGCIAIESEFNHVHAILKSIRPIAVKGSDLLAYGRLKVT